MIRIEPLQTEDREQFILDHHQDPNDPYEEQDTDDQFPDGMFRFEKKISQRRKR